MLGTVRRAGDLLDLFDGAAPEWGATAVSRQLDITKSQAHELLVSLEAIGLLRRAGRGKFRLGWKTVTLSERLVRSEFSAETNRLMRRLATHAGTSVNLMTFDGVNCVRIGGFGPSTHRKRDARATGRVSAPCKILLAGMPHERVAELLPGHDLQAELDRVRERQLAFERDGEHRSVAATVHGGDGAVLAAMGVTVGADVWEARGPQLSRAVTGTAARLTQALRDAEPSAFVMGEPAWPTVAAAGSIAA